MRHIDQAEALRRLQELYAHMVEKRGQEHLFFTLQGGVWHGHPGHVSFTGRMPVPRRVCGRMRRTLIGVPLVGTRREVDTTCGVGRHEAYPYAVCGMAILAMSPSRARCPCHAAGTMGTGAIYPIFYGLGRPRHLALHPLTTQPPYLKECFSPMVGKEPFPQIG